PVVSLLSRETGAVYAGLLSCAYADRLSVFYEADGVGLRIFQCDHRNFHIDQRLFRQLFILCHDIRKHLVIDRKLLASLLEGYAEYLLVLQRSRNVVRINLNHYVFSALLLPQDFHSLICESGSDHSVRYLSLDNGCCISVADIGERDKITE